MYPPCSRKITFFPLSLEDSCLGRPARLALVFFLTRCPTYPYLRGLHARSGHIQPPSIFTYSAILGPILGLNPKPDIYQCISPRPLVTPTYLYGGCISTT